MSVYQQIRLWSITAGCDIVRVSMSDERGGEFFVNIADDLGPKKLRERRDLALDRIMAAMARGDDPGQVIL